MLDINKQKHEFRSSIQRYCRTLLLVSLQFEGKLSETFGSDKSKLRHIINNVLTKLPFDVISDL